MRPEPNKEIDLLLRQLSRRNGVPVSEIDEQHLDADELSSYVANALPPPARARYTEHLADCSSCRKLVAQLSAAEGPVTVQQSASAVAPSGMKSFLASLFSPMVLRYAVPALGLIVIATLGILYLGSGRKGASVAQLSDADQNRTGVAKQQASETPASGYTSDSSKGLTATKEQEPSQVAASPKEGPAPGAKQQSDTASTAGAAPPAAPKPATIEDEPRPAAETQKEKKEPAKQPTVYPYSSADRAEETVKNEARKSDVVTVTPGAVTRRDVEVRAAKSGETAGSGTGAVQNFKRTPAEEKTRSREEAKDTNLSAETRSVAGRRFRKSAGVWIDTDYDASKSVTVVARGSEQFKALVADEPSIRQIAEQLDGEIVVVWKARTYRIR